MRLFSIPWTSHEGKDEQVLRIPVSWVAMRKVVPGANASACHLGGSALYLLSSPLVLFKLAFHHLQTVQPTPANQVLSFSALSWQAQEAQNNTRCCYVLCASCSVDPSLPQIFVIIAQHAPHQDDHYIISGNKLHCPAAKVVTYLNLVRRF